MSGTPQKFAFDTEFDGAGEIAYVAPRPKRSFTPEEVEEIRQHARAEGERAALTSIAAQQMAAISDIARACGHAMPTLAAVAHQHQLVAADLALACGKAIAGAALDLFPVAPVQAALEALQREIEAAPRLIITVHPQMAEQLQEQMEKAAERAGYAGAILVRTDGALGQHAFVLDFGDGAGRFDPAAAAQRVTEALQAALAADGLHGHPMNPGGEG